MTTQTSTYPTDQAAKSAANTIAAHMRGYMTRQQVKVRTVQSGIIHTQIRPSQNKDTPSSLPDEKTPLRIIQDNMSPEAKYDKLRIIGGAKESTILGTKDGEEPQYPLALSKDAQADSVLMSGGFFVHRSGLCTDKDQEITEIGLPVGPVGHRTSHTPIPHPWKESYGDIKIGSDHGLSSGPILMRDGVPTALKEDDRFKYHVGAEKKENPLNIRAGAFTNNGDYNERSALSVTGDDVIMHCFSTSGQRAKGIKMKEWQIITQNAVNDRTTSTLNLDGGPSAFMAIKQKDNHITLISRGGVPEEPLRNVANIVAVRPQTRTNNKEKTLSISPSFA